MNPTDLEGLRARVRELETLCAERYVAAVELGLPQPLLNRLWTVAAHGSMPHAYNVDLPPRLPMPQTAPADIEPMTKRAAAPLEIPDIRLTDHPKAPDTRARAPQAELKPLAERQALVRDQDHAGSAGADSSA